MSGTEGSIYIAPFSWHQKEVTITPEKVLAYRVKQLVFPSAERMGKLGLVGWGGEVGELNT